MREFIVKYKKIIILVFIFVATLSLDLLSKKHVCEVTINGEYFEVIPYVLGFTYSENTGASWGIFSDNTLLLTIFSCIVAFAIFIYLVLAKRAHSLMQLSLTLILSGALGNIYDRIAFGFVRDFIRYTFFESIFNYNFPICNFADLVLVVGCVLMIVFVLFFYNTHYDKIQKEKELEKSKKCLEASVYGGVCENESTLGESDSSLNMHDISFCNFNENMQENQGEILDENQGEILGENDGTNDCENEDKSDENG